MTLTAPPIPKITHRITHQRVQKLGHLVARHRKALVALKDHLRYSQESESSRLALERLNRLNADFDRIADELKAML